LPTRRNQHRKLSAPTYPITAEHSIGLRLRSIRANLPERSNPPLSYSFIGVPSPFWEPPGQLRPGQPAAIIAEQNGNIAHTRDTVRRQRIGNGSLASRRFSVGGRRRCYVIDRAGRHSGNSRDSHPCGTGNAGRDPVRREHLHDRVQPAGCWLAAVVEHQNSIKAAHVYSVCGAVKASQR
jgi:hypothetical protein